MISGGARKQIISLCNSVMHSWFWEKANPQYQNAYYWYFKKIAANKL